MAAKPIIRLGDPTSHGGTVIEAFPTLEIYGKPAAGIGHKVSCPKCKGVFPIVAGATNYQFMGKNVALEGMQTACGAVLIPTQGQATVDVVTSSIASSPSSQIAKSLTGSAPNSSAQMQFNEYFQLHDDSGQPAIGAKYSIERETGDREDGVTDAQGHTHKLSNTNKAEIVKIYFLGYSDD